MAERRMNEMLNGGQQQYGNASDSSDGDSGGDLELVAGSAFGGTEGEGGSILILSGPSTEGTAGQISLKSPRRAEERFRAQKPIPSRVVLLHHPRLHHVEF